MARKPATRKNPPLTPFYGILGAVAVVGALVLLYQVFSPGGGDAATEPVPVELSPAELAQVQGISIGEQDAPVVIYEFADFQCPACADFASFITPLIKERLVQPGFVRYVYYDFPLPSHPHSFLAARAARCAHEQGKFWEYHDLVYGRQPTWSSMRNPVDFFVELGGEVGLDQNAFGACVRSDRYAEEVTRSLRLGESLGVRGTPTLIINGKHSDARNFSEIERAVQAEIGAAGGAAQPTAAPSDSAAAQAPGLS